MDRRQFYEGRAAARPRELERWYYRLLERYYAFLVPPGQRVIELGCGLGDLLASVGPAHGVGIDFSPAMIEEARTRHPSLTFRVADAATYESVEGFDYLLLSDLVNDLPDVQVTLERALRLTHPRSRLVLNFFNNLWRPVLDCAERMGFKAPTLDQNWLSTADMRNLLELAGWEVLRTDCRILWPIRTPVWEGLLNRWLAPLLRHLCLAVFIVARPKPRVAAERQFTCSVVVPARNEAGNLEALVTRVPELGLGTELILIEGHSTDNTWEELGRVAARHPDRRLKTLQQKSRGKGGAVREAFAVATGDLLFILDADLTVAPEELPKFYEAARGGTGEFINGVRLVYPREPHAMRFLNMVANKLFGLAFSWLLGQPIKDTLCGTKVLWRADYEAIARGRGYFGEFDPFGDFDLLFGAAKLSLRIVDLPIRYHARTYGATNIQRWRHGWLLARMVGFAARRLKFL
ncbi:MAG: glycosyltransferase [Verrucomicrobia bacterium]|nr:glycosyltransferase [Verrucomicrobiota bacterium]